MSLGQNRCVVFMICNCICCEFCYMLVESVFVRCSDVLCELRSRLLSGVLMVWKVMVLSCEWFSFLRLILM